MHKGLQGVSKLWKSSDRQPWLVAIEDEDYRESFDVVWRELRLFPLTLLQISLRPSWDLFGLD